MGFLGGVGQMRRNFPFLALAVAVGGLCVGFHPNLFYDAVDVALGSQRMVDGHGRAPEKRLHAFQRALEG